MIRRAVGGVGISNATIGQLRQALPVGVACVQNAYSLLDRSAEPLLALCLRHGTVSLDAATIAVLDAITPSLPSPPSRV